MLLLLVAIFIYLMSLLAFVAFRSDKARSMRGDWRISEASLLLLALLGGWPGAKLAQARFRHKTRKEPFRTMLNLCLAGPVILVGAAAMVVATPALDAKLRGAASEILTALGQEFWHGISDVDSGQNTVIVRRGSDIGTYTIGN